MSRVCVSYPSLLTTRDFQLVRQHLTLRHMDKKRNLSTGNVPLFLLFERLQYSVVDKAYTITGA